MKYRPAKYCLPVLLLLAAVMPATAQRHITAELQRYTGAAPFQMAPPALPDIPHRRVLVTDFGAVGDGHTLNTPFIQKAIDSCAATGGGTVVVPAGLWLTGPLVLKSRINLHLAQGAIVLFSPDHSVYPIIRTGPESHSYFVMSPVYGYDLHDIAITGPGIINGNGRSWRPVKKEKMTPSQWNDLVHSGGVVSDDGEMWWPSKEAMNGEAYLKSLKKSRHDRTAKDYLPARDFMRPYMVSLIGCSRVLLDGPTFMNSPKFALYPKYSHDLVIRNVKVNNEWWAQNGDGIDLANCRNAVVYKCTVNAGDDGICMKSSRPSGDKTDSACLSNVIIADCIVYHGHGGFVIGSNTDGGMKNIYVHNCDFIHTDVGIRVKSRRDRGGLVHDIYISGIYMAGIAGPAISFDTYYELKTKNAASHTVTSTTPRFRDFHMDHVYCQGAEQAVTLTGLPEMSLSHLHFSDMNITAAKGYTAVDTASISFKNVTINGRPYNR